MNPEDSSFHSPLSEIYLLDYLRKRFRKVTFSFCFLLFAFSIANAIEVTPFVSTFIDFFIDGTQAFSL